MSNKVQNYITGVLKTISFVDCRSINIGGNDKRGMPDIEIFYPEGKVMFVEVKSEVTKDRLKKDGLQAFRMGQLRDIGHDVRIAATMDDAHRICMEVIDTVAEWLVRGENDTST